MTPIARRSAIAAALALAAGAAMAQGSPAGSPPAGEGALDRIRRTKLLRIGAIASGAPYYLKDLASGEWKGFYVDLAKLLATELDAKLDITETTWGNSILDLETNKIDIFFGLNPLPSRALVVDFSDAIFNNAYAFVMKPGLAAKTWDELNNPAVRIGVDSGSSHDLIVTRFCPKAQISRFRTADEATLAVQTGRVDAQCLVIILALAVKKKVPGLGPVVTPTPTLFTTSNAGFRREPDKTWRDFVNVWIGYNRNIGTIRAAILANMALVGVEEGDFPTGLTL